MITHFNPQIPEATTNERNFRLSNRVESRPMAQAARRGRRDFAAERAAQAEQERRIREMEDARIAQINEHIVSMSERLANINEQIEEIKQRPAALSTAETFYGPNGEIIIPEITQWPDDPEQLLETLNEETERLQGTILSLSAQIGNIHMARAEREQIAIEREFMRKQQEMDERMRERERIAQERENARLENKSQEELENSAERNKMRNMVMMGTRLENISSLSRTRASLSAAATRLQGEAGFDGHRQRIANEQIHSFVRADNERTLELHQDRMERSQYNTANGRPTPPPPPWRPMVAGHTFNDNPLALDGFRGRHLQNLNNGISRLSANINAQVGALYRDSQAMQEQQLRIYREKATAPSENDDENSIDLRL
jgi:hypothetical protein